MKLKPGPTNSYPLGGPSEPGDRGAVLASFKIVREIGMCVFNFGTTISWATQPANEALHQAHYMREMVIAAFGPLPVDPTTFPFQIEPHPNGMVKTDFKQNVATVVANPELFLVWADKLEECAKKMLQEGGCSRKEAGH